MRVSKIFWAYFPLSICRNGDRYRRQPVVRSIYLFLAIVVSYVFIQTYIKRFPTMAKEAEQFFGPRLSYGE